MSTVSEGSTRRKSFAFFSRPSILPSDSDSSVKQRPKSLLFGASGLQEVSAIVSSNVAHTSQHSKSPKVLTKSPTARPKSMFGSMKSRRSSDAQLPTSPTVLESSASSSFESDTWNVPTTPTAFSSVVVHAGEVVTGGGLLRKRREYMVLTTHELLRYKSESKANEAFGLGGRSHAAGARASSVISFGDSEHALLAKLENVVAVYHIGPDGGSGCSIQLDYVDNTGSPSSTVLVASTANESQKWVDALRKWSTHVRSATPSAEDFTEATEAYVRRRIEADRDFSPTRFRMFRVVQRSVKSGARSSSVDDMQKMYSSICYLAFGLHKIYLVPIKVSTTNKSTTSLAAMVVSSYAILNLTALSISDADDGFSLSFRLSCRATTKLNLASTYAGDIIQLIRQAAEFLRPNWQMQPFAVHIPDCLKLADAPLPFIPCTPGDDLGGFDRTLAAYCTAYDLDASNIAYAVLPDVEDGPQFVLCPPVHSRRRHYTDLELLAIMRTLRWNETIGSISFRGISLDSLTNICDNMGTEYEPRCERSGRYINLKTVPGQRSLLVHELRALALYSGKLRRMDFSGCFKRRPAPSMSESCTNGNGNTDEKACAAVEAIMPLCRRGYTNVDWFVLTGLDLCEADLDWLIDAAASRLAHFRGFELARCGLTERMITLFLNALITHENTMECLDLSGNPARMHSPSLNNTMAYFPYLRKLNLSRLLRTSGNDPVLTSETLLRWRLEDLDLSETKLNSQSVDAVATYLASTQSDSLRHLALTQCGLTAKDVAVLMHAMRRTPDKARGLHLHIGQNALAQNASHLIDCIRTGVTPSHLTMRMVDYLKEETFREMVRAFAVNTTIVFLDISKTSLPYEAGEQTCTELGKMFAENTTLRELDISGEQAVLESARLGSGLVKALARLAENKTLEILRIELQALGIPGAMELASMLRRNTTLREIHCEQNDIHIQGFTALVNAIEENHTLTYFPRMDRDRADQMRCLKEKLFQTPPDSSTREEDKKKSSFRRSSYGTKAVGKKVSFSQDDVLGLVGVEKSLMLMEEKWESEGRRLEKLLAQNLVEHVESSSAAAAAAAATAAAATWRS